MWLEKAEGEWTGPPEDLRSRRERETASLDESAAVQPSETVRCISEDAESHHARRLATVGAEVEGTRVPPQILADFTGARADPRFLENRAKQNPSKFRQFLDTVVNWLKLIAQKLSNAGSVIIARSFS